MQNRTVLISGASIAGPALAHWLSRYGFTPTVVERSPALRTGGYKIDIRGIAVTVAQRSGILQEVRRRASDVRGASFVDSSGRRVADLDADFVQGREGDDLEIMRGKLSRVLYDTTRDDVEYLFGDSITGLCQDTDGVDVTFEHAPPRRFDLVVGADGLHSNVRRLTFGPEARYRRDLGYYICIFSTPNVLGLDRWELFHTLPGRLANTYAARGDDQAKALFFFASLPLQLDRHDVAAQQEVLARTFADAGWEVPRLLDTMRDAPDFYFDSTSQIVMDRWSDGRVVLLGDAAYCPSPASGQGASTALVGAYLLAGSSPRRAATTAPHSPPTSRGCAPSRRPIRSSRERRPARSPPRPSEPSGGATGCCASCRTCRGRAWSSARSGARSAKPPTRSRCRTTLRSSRRPGARLRRARASIRCRLTGRTRGRTGARRGRHRPGSRTHRWAAPSARTRCSAASISSTCTSNWTC